MASDFKDATSPRVQSTTLRCLNRSKYERTVDKKARRCCKGVIITNRYRDERTTERTKVVVERKQDAMRASRHTLVTTIEPRTSAFYSPRPCVTRHARITVLRVFVRLFANFRTHSDLPAALLPLTTATTTRSAAIYTTSIRGLTTFDRKPAVRRGLRTALGASYAFDLILEHSVLIRCLATEQTFHLAL